MSDRLTTVRKALMWWFHWPGNPYVSITIAIDFSGAQAYLEQLAGGGQESVSVNHLAVAAVARVLREFPEANAWLVGDRIERQPHVGVAMPVWLEGHSAGAKQELSLAVLDEADTLTLRGVARAGRHEVSAERRGEISNRLIRTVSGIVDRLPFGVLTRGLDLFNLVTGHPLAARALQRQLGFTTVVTNVGPAFARLEGAMLRGVAFEIPQRLFHLGTVWGLSAVQDEVFAVDGEPRVCPALPVLLVFDHRLFDGVRAGRLLVRFAEILRDPAAVFGDTGDLPIWEERPATS
jgi:pyruvate/2-oxoglutarate dehydrogenase complex dihydrolipoamide acyltransferase (E2) component